MAAQPSPLESSTQQIREQQLIQRIRDGAHELFYDLIQPYKRRVYAAAFAILRNEADAEDAVSPTNIIRRHLHRALEKPVGGCNWPVLVSGTSARVLYIQRIIASTYLSPLSCINCSKVSSLPLCTRATGDNSFNQPMLPVRFLDRSMVAAPLGTPS
jgi:hypothetical protein